jgi:ferredoxin
MKVAADWDLCESNGFCERVAPEMFHVNDKDELDIANDGEYGPELADKVREAVRICPKMALSIQELGPSRSRALP